MKLNCFVCTVKTEFWHFKWFSDWLLEQSGVPHIFDTLSPNEFTYDSTEKPWQPNHLAAHFSFDCVLIKQTVTVEMTSFLGALLTFIPFIHCRYFFFFHFECVRGCLCLRKSSTSSYYKYFSIYFGVFMLIIVFLDAIAQLSTFSLSLSLSVTHTVQ